MSAMLSRAGVAGYQPAWYGILQIKSPMPAVFCVTQHALPAGPSHGGAGQV